MRSRNKPSNIKQLDWDRSPPFMTTTVIGLAFIRDVKTFARAVYLEVAYGALGIDSCEATPPILVFKTRLLEGGARKRGD